MRLGELLERTVPPLGYELVDWEMSGPGRLLRVFIDKEPGVDVDDCARVSDHLTRLFAVENVDYDRLEMSSPGLDRPLTKLADYARFAGEEAQINLHEMTDGARRWKCVLRGVEGDNVLVDTADGSEVVPLCGDRPGPPDTEDRVEKVQMNRELLLLVDALAREKNVPKDIVFVALESALASATKKRFPTQEIDARVSIDRESGDYDAFRRWTVVPDEEHEEPAHQIAITDAEARVPAAGSWATSSRSRSSRSSSAASARRRRSRSSCRRSATPSASRSSTTSSSATTTCSPARSSASSAATSSSSPAASRA